MLDRIVARLGGALRVLLVAMVLGAAALAAHGCAAAQALNPKAVYGMRSDPDFGRCGYAGMWVGSSPGARTLLTAHACLRVENGASGPGADAGAPEPDAASGGQ